MKNYIFTMLILVSYLFLSCEKKGNKSDFYGEWYYSERDMTYIITEENLFAYCALDNTNFTVKISSWEFITNKENNSDDYPNGFKITGRVEQMKGGWWISEGDVDSWIWYINKDKNSLVTDDVIYIKR